MRWFTHEDPKKPIYNLIYIFVGLTVLMVGYFAYFLVVRSDEVINNAYNKRQDILSQRVVRGSILSADGEVLAQTVTDGEGKETREYPFGKVFAHVVGRYSKGKTGIEEAENIRLLTSNINVFELTYSDLTGEKSPGDNVVTTLDAGLQKVAYDALGDYRGAVVVMEPSTGKILAMVSKPSYDPNKIDEIWEELTSDEEEETDAPLLNRATQGFYPPGSTFKVLTALEYVRENPDYPDYHFNCEGKTVYDSMTIHCYNNKVHGEEDLNKSFAKSCNTSFANIGRELDLKSFRELCESFLFNQRLPITMESIQSRFVLREGAGVNTVMQTAIGQGKTVVTPLHNAMITAAIANQGEMMKPYVVDHIENVNGGIVKRYSPQTVAKPITQWEAGILAKMMRSVVTDGTAEKLDSLSVKVAGKTGSADHKENEPAHAWFIGYAPYEEPQIVVSVIVESVGTGSDYAVPIAKKVFKAYFKDE
ncbi:MAG TPA: penicillin-binding protein 2 [Clostridiales bacterium]|nr:penicillin-binding protein 2 [Clostridiales bacterium]